VNASCHLTGISSIGNCLAAWHDDGFLENPTIPCTGADEPFQRRKRQADARLKLAFLKRHDRIVESYRRLATRDDLSEAQIESWRQRRRSEYQRATGVAIELGDSLSAGLEHIAETGDGSVGELIVALQQDYAKGLSLALGGSGRTAEGGFGNGFQIKRKR